MKYLPTALLLLTGICSTAVPTIAQQVPSTAGQDQPVVTPSTLLLTEPASVRRAGVLAQPQLSPYDLNDLNAVAGSVQVKPQRPQNPLPSVIPDSLVPQQPPKPTTVNPIDYFQPPSLDSGVKLSVPTD